MRTGTTIKSLILSAIVTLAATLQAGPAFALIHGEFSVGNRSGKFINKSLSGTTIEVAGHLDPIILIPVSVGVRLVNDTFNPSAKDHSLKSLTATAIVPEASAWIPLGDLEPFARVGYTAISAYKGTVDVAGLSGDVGYKSSGVRLAAGVRYSFLPLIYLSAAFEQSTEKLSISDKLSGFNIDTEFDFSNTAIVLGVKAGI